MKFLRRPLCLYSSLTDMDNTLGLYLHIPFCIKKCNYCNFYSDKDNSLKDAYIKMLIKDNQKWGEKLSSKSVDTVFFGGGTPSVIGERAIVLLLNEIRRCFKVADGAEITVECNPESSDLSFFKSLKKNGVNRVSIGVQSFNNSELLALGRAHSAEQAERAVNSAREAGFDNINIDLMFALPEQSMDSLKYSLSKTVSLPVTHISAYALKIEKGTPFYIQRKSLELPDEDAEFEQYKAICDTVKEYIFTHYEISNFAKEGYECRHNLKYWKLKDYLGLGVSAHSFIDGKRFYFKSDTLAYTQGLLKPVCEKTDGITEYIMLSLRINEGMSFNRISALCGSKIAERMREQANIFCKSDFGEFKAESFYLNKKGFFVSNAIIGKFADIAAIKS